jgi:hypothetical protein
MDRDIDVPPAGYIFGAEALSVVADTVTKLLQHDPRIVYLLDRKQLHSPNNTPADAKLLPLPTQLSLATQVACTSPQTSSLFTVLCSQRHLS